MKPSNYTFPVLINNVNRYVVGERVTLRDRDDLAISGIIVDVKKNKTTALVTIDIDSREDEL